jgi:hypothetical protein
MSVTIVHRKPSVEEFESIVESVGFRAHDHPAVETALANTVFCVCAEEERRTVGVGRVVGDGAIRFFSRMSWCDLLTSGEVSAR